MVLSRVFLLGLHADLWLLHGLLDRRFGVVRVRVLALCLVILDLFLRVLSRTSSRRISSGRGAGAVGAETRRSPSVSVEDRKCKEGSLIILLSHPGQVE